jgi:hypothetical protein
MARIPTPGNHEDAHPPPRLRRRRRRRGRLAGRLPATGRTHPAGRGCLRRPGVRPLGARPPRHLFGGWCNAITRCTGQDYQADTYDVSGGRFFTVSAYGNRVENTYLAHNRTTDLTVRPWHYNQNQGEQIMWEFMDPVSEQQPSAVGESTLTFAQPIKDKENKVAWYTTAVVTAGQGLGLVARRNRVQNMAEVAFMAGGRFGKDGLAAKLVLEHSTVEGAPVAVQVGNPRNTPGDGLAILVRSTILRLGAAAKAGSTAVRAAAASMVFDRGNAVEGFAAAYAPFPEPPPKK